MCPGHGLFSYSKDADLLGSWCSHFGVKRLNFLCLMKNTSLYYGIISLSILRTREDDETKPGRLDKGIIIKQ